MRNKKDEFGLDIPEPYWVKGEDNRRSQEKESEIEDYYALRALNKLIRKKEQE